MKLNLNININPNSALFIEASSLAELDAVREYLQGQGIQTGLPDGKGAEKVAKPEGASPAAAKTEKPAAGAKKEAPAKKDAKAAASAKTVAGPTIEEVTAALTAVADKFGVPEALAMNKRFGVKKAGELKAEQYADYIKFANHCVEDEVEPTGSHEDFNGTGEEAAEEDDVNSLV
jgi:hypothetical protein